MKRGLTIIPVSTIAEVLSNALVTPPSPIEWTEADQPPAISKPIAEQGDDVIRH